MKRKSSAREIAQEMANIIVDHLETLPAQERHTKIKAGQKVIQGLKLSASSSFNAGEPTKDGPCANEIRFK